MPQRYRLAWSAAVIFGCAVSPGQEVRVFSDSDKLAIEQMYERYNQAFIKRDYATIRQLVQARFLVWTKGDLQTLETVDAVVALYRTAREPLEQRNYSHSKIVATRITPTSADSALINAAYRRFRKDGSLLEDGAALYLVSKSSGSWKLCGLVRQESPYFGKVY